MEIIFTRVRSFLRESGPRGWTKGHTQTVHADGTISYCLGGMIEILGGAAIGIAAAKYYQLESMHQQINVASKRAGRMLSKVLQERSVMLANTSSCNCTDCRASASISIPSLNDSSTTTFQDILTTVERLAAEDEEHMITAPVSTEAPATIVEQSALELVAV